MDERQPITETPEFIAATKLMNKLYEFNLSRNFGPRPPTNRLFHYTNAEGLTGILQSGNVWASSAYCLNDASEIEYGCKIMRDAISERQGRFTTIAPNRLLSDLNRSLESELLKGDTELLIYVTCFCEADNLLSQWRAYGQRGGYSLGFEVSNGEIRGLQPKPSTYTAKLGKVEYSVPQQIQKCSAVLDPLLAILTHSEGANALLTVSPNRISSYATYLSYAKEMLLEEIALLKHPAFESEKEWRLVVRRRALLKQGTDDGSRMPARPSFRTSMGMAVPYLSIVPLQGRLPIRSVRIGPTISQGPAESSLRLLLESKGYQGIDILGSGIPIRL